MRSTIASQGRELLGAVLDAAARVPEQHHRAVVGGVVHRRARQHQPVDQRDGQAGRGARGQRAHRPSRDSSRGSRRRRRRGRAGSGSRAAGRLLDDARWAIRASSRIASIVSRSWLPRSRLRRRRTRRTRVRGRTGAGSAAFAGFAADLTRSTLSVIVQNMAELKQYRITRNERRRARRRARSGRGRRARSPRASGCPRSAAWPPRPGSARRPSPPGSPSCAGAASSSPSPAAARGSVRGRRSAPARDACMPVPAGARDLSRGNPDPELLPDLGRPWLGPRARTSLRRAAGARPGLLALARSSSTPTGSPAGDSSSAAPWTAIERVLEANLRPGDRVAVEDPGYSASLTCFAPRARLEPVESIAAGCSPTSLLAQSTVVSRP